MLILSVRLSQVVFMTLETIDIGHQNCDSDCQETLMNL